MGNTSSHCSAGETYLSNTRYGELCCPAFDARPYYDYLDGSSCTTIAQEIDGEVVPVRTCTFTMSEGAFQVPPNIRYLKVDVTGGPNSQGTAAGAWVGRDDFKVTPGEIYKVIVNEGRTMDSGGYSAFGTFRNGFPSDYMYDPVNNPDGDDRLVVAGGAGGGYSTEPFLAGGGDEDAPGGLAISGSADLSTGQYSDGGCVNGQGFACQFGGGGGYRGGAGGSAISGQMSGGAGGSSNWPDGDADGVWHHGLADLGAPASVKFSWTDGFACSYVQSVELDYAETQVEVAPEPITLDPTTLTLQATIETTLTQTDSTETIVPATSISISTVDGPVSTTSSISTITPSVVTKHGSTSSATATTSKAVATVGGALIKTTDVAHATSTLTLSTRSARTKTKTSTSTQTLRPTSAPKSPIYRVTFPAGCCPAKSHLARRSDEESIPADIEAFTDRLRSVDPELYSSLALRDYDPDYPRPDWLTETATDNGGGITLYNAIGQAFSYWDIHSTTTTSIWRSLTVTNPLIQPETVISTLTASLDPTTSISVEHLTLSTTLPAPSTDSTTTLPGTTLVVTSSTTLEPSTTTESDGSVTSIKTVRYSLTLPDSTSTLSSTSTAVITSKPPRPPRSTTTKVIHKTVTARPAASPARTIDSYKQKKCYGRRDDLRIAAAVVRDIRKASPSSKIIVDCGSSGSYTV